MGAQVQLLCFCEGWRGIYGVLGLHGLVRRTRSCWNGAVRHTAGTLHAGTSMKHIAHRQLEYGPAMHLGSGKARTASPVPRPMASCHPCVGAGQLYAHVILMRLLGEVVCLSGLLAPRYFVVLCNLRAVRQPHTSWNGWWQSVPRSPSSCDHARFSARYWL